MNKIKSKIGETTIDNNGQKITIINYRGTNDIDVIFNDDFNTLVTNVTYNSFKKHKIKNPFYPYIFNKGYLGVQNKKNKNNISKTKSYVAWYNMLNRCYNPKYLEQRKTYEDKYVCDDWLCYTNFKKWWDENYYEVYNEEMALDKDILLKNNKCYSPNTCCIVTKHINSLFTKSDCNRNICIGVTYRKDNSKKPYVSTVSINGKNKSKRFNTKEEAFLDYKIRKENEIKRLANKYKNFIPQNLYDAMYNYEVEIID